MLERLRLWGAMALFAGLGGCASTPPPHQTSGTPSGYAAGPALVAGEALVRAEAPPDPARLAEQAGLEGLVIVDCVHQFGRVYRVRFERAGGVPADEELTRRAIDAFGSVAGILSSEPNRLEQPKPSATARP